MQSEPFNELLKSLKTGYIVLSILFCICGISILLNPTVSTITLCYILGFLIISFGIIKICGYFSRNYYRYVFQYDLAFGILIIILGIIILFHPYGILTLFHTLLGILFLMDGLFKIQLAVDTKTFGIKQWWLVFIFAILAVILGILMILQPLKSAAFIAILLGITLLAEGILNLCTIFFASKLREYHY